MEEDIHQLSCFVGHPVVKSNNKSHFKIPKNTVNQRLQVLA